MKLILILFFAFMSVESFADKVSSSEAAPNSANPAGFRLLNIETGGVYEKLGLKNGDVIKSINGKPVVSRKDAMLLITLIANSPRIDIEIERDGKTQKLRYQVK